MSDSRKVSYHYLRAWPLLVFSVLCYFLTSTVASSMNIAAGILEAERGWSSTLITSCISIASLANVVFGFLAGRACVGHSAKRLCVAWGALYLAGVAFMGISKLFALFAVSMVVANAASSALGYNTVPVLLASWFPQKKGTVQGFVSMGIPLGAGFASMVYSWGYSQLGIDAAFVPFMVIAAVSIALLALGVSDTPEERGLEPDTMERCEPHKPALAVDSADGAALPGNSRELLRNPRFLALSAVLGIQLIYSGGLMVQIAPRLFEIGYTMDEAVLAMLVSALFACAGSFICGVIGDRFGSRVGAILTFAVGIAAVLLNLVGNPACVFASLALIGVVTGGADNWPVNICAEYFGRDGFSGSFGLMFPIIQLVGAVGPGLFAIVAGATGSYFVSYVCAAALMGVGLVLFVALTRNGLLGEKESR